MITKALSPRTTTIVRTTNPEYLDVWREGQLDVDFIVSSEVETALAVSRAVGVPAARQTDVFAEGQVQLVEFDVIETRRPEHHRRAAARGEPAAPTPGWRRSSAATRCACRAATTRSGPATGSS